MTEGQKNYIADLANKKGIILEDTLDKSAAWASAKIEELKLLPDGSWDSIDDSHIELIQSKIDKIIKDMSRWTFRQ